MACLFPIFMVFPFLFFRCLSLSCFAANSTSETSAARSRAALPPRDTRDAACEGRMRADLQTRERSFAGRSCGPLRPCGHKFRIQYSKFRMMNSGRSLRNARKFGYELRASAAGRLRHAVPLLAQFMIQNSKLPEASMLDRFECPSKPAAERRCLRRRGAALRPGAAAGCRSLRDRFCQQAFPSNKRLRSADPCRLEFAGRPFHLDRRANR